jgi:hypothetical protein
MFNICVPVPSQDLYFQHQMSWSFCVRWIQLRWEAIVRFFYIGGIDDHHCLNFLLNNMAFQSLAFERIWWRLFLLFWAYLMKVIMSVSDEGYYERIWWRLFLKCIVCSKFDIYVFILFMIIWKKNRNENREL